MNKKYHELLEDLDNNFREAINELGNDEAQTLLSNRLKAPIDLRKDGTISNTENSALASPGGKGSSCPSGIQ